MLSPVAIFCYVRLDHLELTVASLLNSELAEQTEVIFFSDAAKNERDVESVKAVRAFVKSVSGFKSVSLIERETNWGLRKSILSGVSEVLNQSPSIIVLEDDIVVAPGFLSFMNECLQAYQKRTDVFSVSGFSYVDVSSMCDLYAIDQPMCWGWGTWRTEWSAFMANDSRFLKCNRSEQKQLNYNGAFNFYQQYQLNLSGAKDTWYINWYIFVFKNNGYNIYPSKSLTKNVGFDGSGENSSDVVDYNCGLSEQLVFVGGDVSKAKVSGRVARKEIECRLKALKPSLFKRITRRFGRAYEEYFHR